MEPRFEDQWRTRFEEFADQSDSDAGIAGWTTTGLDTRVRRFLGLWTSDPRERQWLDAGCGAGTYTRILLGHRHEVIGVDYSLPTLRKAVARGLEGAAFTVADVRRLPFRTEQFDGVLCFGVTQALTESASAVHELARSVRPGGELWVDGLNSWCLLHAYGALRRRLLGRRRHLRYESPWRIKKLCRECGLTDVRLYWMPIMPASARRLQRFVESRSIGWLLSHLPLAGMLISHGFIVHSTKSK
jgi:ubiquinone/menaquinone biosynthesis C-methylase UbiE